MTAAELVAIRARHAEQGEDRYPACGCTQCVACRDRATLLAALAARDAEIARLQAVLENAKQLAWEAAPGGHLYTALAARR
jgi:hypothetical protein